MKDIVLLKKYCIDLSILYVEDDEVLHESVVRYLKKFFKHVETAFDGEEGLHKYKVNTFDIVLTDIKMPKMDGIEMVKRIRAKSPEQQIVILSAHTETNYFLDSIHAGVSDYIIKPIDYEQMNEVLYKIANGIHIRNENHIFQNSMNELVTEQTRELSDNYEHTLSAMVDMIESRDSYTGGHSERVANYAQLIAKEMKLSEIECELVHKAGMLHDIGKMTTPDTILLKPGKLSKREHSLIQAHVTVSYQLLSKIPMYAKLSEIVMSHHERYDGKGYPKGLRADEIPLLAQIMIIADAFDAMTTNRIYKGRKTLDEAIAEVQNCSGTQFDPRIVPFACKALAHVHLNKSITQLPKNTMENERFSYFFHDSVTDAYNQDYLELFLNSNEREKKHIACVCFLKRFSQYNKKYGWDKGNELLKKFAEHLQSLSPETVLFRIHGDDFLIISEDLNLELSHECTIPPLLNGTGVGVQCHKFLVNEDILSQINSLDEE